MAKGWDPIAEQTQETQARRERAQETFLPELRVGAKNQGPFQIRFLEQGPDVNTYPVHEYKVLENGATYNRRFTCLTEAGISSNDCPGCKAGLKRKWRGVYNLIQRNRPVYRKGQDGKAMRDAANQYIIDGYADTVVVANVGGPTSEMLRKTDGSMGGLMSRDWVVSFSGDTFQSWFMQPVADSAGNSMATPMSEADYALAAAKHDLDKYMAPPTIQEAAQIVARYGANSGAQQQAPQGPPAQPVNPLLQGIDPNVLGAMAASGQPHQQPQTVQQQAPSAAPAPSVPAPPTHAA